MNVRKWAIPVLMAAAGLLASCPGDILKNLDNPMDPKAFSYQGYHTVEGADEVEAHTPSDGGSLVFQRFIISEARGAEAYHLQIASSVDFGNALYDGDSHTANIMLADAPLSLNTVYYWRGRAKQGGQWGKWTDGWKFTMTTIGGLKPRRWRVPLTDTTPMLQLERRARSGGI